MCLIIGEIDIIVNASDEVSGIERVEFYIDGKLKASVNQEPFIFNWKRDRRRLFIHSHIVKVVGFDNSGNSAKDTIIVRKFF